MTILTYDEDHVHLLKKRGGPDFSGLKPGNDMFVPGVTMHGEVSPIHSSGSINLRTDQPSVRVVNGTHGLETGLWDFTDTTRGRKKPPTKGAVTHVTKGVAI